MAKENKLSFTTTILRIGNNTGICVSDENIAKFPFKAANYKSCLMRSNNLKYLGNKSMIKGIGVIFN
ncbi:MAG: hypothetical protein AVDCRST_MAG96-3745 [uncultured Segetibacter sp.]|uniref:Uncharacterized protein n=1 Tax=uncultured Segetibacter sp. TaxID=481133 RepID=A0A6J4TVN4_9BACT|nr:MAG: hypothetical protein AVDCRST_MAG96-3745 [uncultured Segetibacter sp.]